MCLCFCLCSCLCQRCTCVHSLFFCVVLCLFGKSESNSFLFNEHKHKHKHKRKHSTAEDGLSLISGSQPRIRICFAALLNVAPLPPHSLPPPPPVQIAQEHGRTLRFKTVGMFGTFLKVMENGSMSVGRYASRLQSNSATNWMQLISEWLPNASNTEEKARIAGISGSQCERRSIRPRLERHCTRSVSQPSCT